MASRQGSAPEALRIALVGKTGCGKSSTGNTILGENKFEAKPFGKSVTQRCSKIESDIDGRRVAVVDTPGLFDTTMSNEQIMTETCKCINLLCPGPHAFLLLLKIGRFTEEEQRAVECIKGTFGEDAEKYIVIIFTGGDELENHETSIEDYLRNSEHSLQKLVSNCGNRFQVFNNREKDRAQVKELLLNIDDMVRKNGGSHYTSKMFQEAEEAIQREKRRILKAKQQEIRKKEAEIKRKYQQEMKKVLEEAKQKQDEENKEREKKFTEELKKIKDEQERRECEQRERERQREKERDMERQREEQQREMERKRAEDIQRLSYVYEQRARRDAETDNSFEDHLANGVGSVVRGVGSVVRGLFSFK